MANGGNAIKKAFLLRALYLKTMTWLSLAVGLTIVLTGFSNVGLAVFKRVHPKVG